MSLICFNSPKDQNFFDLIKKYRFQLSDPKLTLSDIHQMSDHLAAVFQNETNSKLVAEEVTAFFGEIENKENQRRVEDQNLLTFIHQLGFEIKQLKLQIDVLAPSVIETKLNDLSDWHLSLSRKGAFQNDFFKNELNYLRSMLEDLIFRFHFPVVEILEKSTNDKVLQSFKEIQEYFFERKDDPLFSHKDLTCFLEKKLHKAIKHLKKESDRHFVTQIILDYLQETIGL